MSIKGVEASTQRFAKLKKLGPIVLVAALLAAVIVGVMLFFGLIDSLPIVPIFVLGVMITPTWTVYLSAFVLSATLVLVYVTYGKAIRRIGRKTKRYWLGLPQRAKAVVLGLETGIVAGLSVYVVDVLAFDYPALLSAGVGVAGWVVVVLLTLYLLEKEWDLAEWAKALNTGALISGVVAVLFAFVFANVVPGFGINVVFFLGWVLASYALARRTYAVEDSVVTRLLVSSGYAQMRQVNRLLVSVATGFGVGLLVAVLVGLFGSTPSSPILRTGLSISVVWPMVVVAVYWGWPSHERTNLIIEGIKPRDDGDRELTVRNVGDSSVDLGRAKLRDAENRIYGMVTAVSLGAGQARKLRITEEFTLDSSGKYLVIDLPFGFSLEKEATHPSVITRDGRRFTLLWADEVTESDTSHSRGSHHQPDSSNTTA